MSEVTVMRGGAVGDFILTLPAIEAVRRACPRASLRLIGNPETVSLARPDSIVDHSCRDLVPLFGPEEPLPAATERIFASTELLLAYVADDAGDVVRRLRAAVGGDVLHGDPRPAAIGTHASEHLLSPVKAAGIPVADPLPRVRLDAAQRQFADALPAGEGPIVVIHPGSGGRHKCWPMPLFADLVAELPRLGARPVVITGPAEAVDLPQMQRAVSSICPILCAPKLAGLAAILERADAFVGNDSGPGHLAAAVGTPTVSLFGPTDPATWMPLGHRCEVVLAPRGELKLLRVDSVLEAVMGVLDD